MTKISQLLYQLTESVSSDSVKTAYSYERMGYMIAEALLAEMEALGLSDKAAEWLFRSKHMRWFLDMYGSEIAMLAGKKLKAYLKENKNHVMTDLKKYGEGENP